MLPDGSLKHKAVVGSNLLLGDLLHRNIVLGVVFLSPHVQCQHPKVDFAALLRRVVGRVSWEPVLEGKGVQECWAFFKKELQKAHEQAVPMHQKMSWRGIRQACLNRELRLYLRKKKRGYDLWKKGQVTGPQSAIVVKDNKKIFKYINKKRRTKVNLHHLLGVGRNIVRRDDEKAEVFNAFFASIFAASCCQGTQPTELVGTGKRMKPS